MTMDMIMNFEVIGGGSDTFKVGLAQRVLSRWFFCSSTKREQPRFSFIIGGISRNGVDTLMAGELALPLMI